MTTTRLEQRIDDMIALYSTSWMDGQQRLERQIRYLKWYSSLRREIGFDRIVLADNASELKYCTMLKEQDEYDWLQIHRFDHREIRAGSHYPCVWRGLFYIRGLIALGYKKIIYIETDAFVLTRRFAHAIRDTESGWTSVRCKTYGWPEAAYFTLCEDAFPAFMKFTEGDYNRYNGQIYETALPFTSVREDFNSGRFGEQGLEQEPSMDLYCQLLPEIKLEYKC